MPRQVSNIKGNSLCWTEPKAINYLKTLWRECHTYFAFFDFVSVDEAKLDKPQYNWGL